MSSRKKAKLTCGLKRKNETDELCNKRLRVENNEDVIKKQQATRRKNFVTACEQVSLKAYFDHSTRFQLLYLPNCKNSLCKHNNQNGTVTKEMPPYAEDLFKIELEKNLWDEALEVCQMSITPTQHLSVNVLKNIVEIIMNAHESSCTDYSIHVLIDKCQHILSQNFNIHPPCLSKSIRKCYNNFLTSPMDLKENTFTNRKQFGCDKGIVKYCVNRLEYEISSESKDEPLVDKIENIPEDMIHSVKGLHWQKKTLEIFETLDRVERIKRLMAVLESIIELLQFDLAIWNSRHTNNLGGHIMRSHKPLMAYILWSTDILYTGAVTNNCRQILRLFVYLVHLQYPDEHIKIMTNWLNIIIQTFSMCETNSNSDYPNTGKYCTAFANEFYKIISDLPQKSIIRILEKIYPSYMQHLVGSLHVKKILSTKEDNIIKVLINFVTKSQWEKFPKAETDIKLSKCLVLQPRKFRSIMNYLTKKCKAWESIDTSGNISNNLFLKFDPDFRCNDNVVDQNIVVHTLYITLEAYLDAYSMQFVQETLDKLNEQLVEDKETSVNNSISEMCTYTVTEDFIKKYRTIYKLIQELMTTLLELKTSEQLPDILKIFEKIGLLSFQ